MAAVQPAGRSAMEEQTRLEARLRSTALQQYTFLLLGLALTVVGNDLAWSDDPDGVWIPSDDRRIAVTVLRAATTLTTLIAVHRQHKYYSAEVAVLRRRSLVIPSTSVLGSPLGPAFVGEALLCLLHVFPGVDAVDPTPNLLLACTAATCARVLLVGRPLRHLSSLNSTNGRFISALTSVDFTTAFVLKTVIKTRPGRCLGAGLGAALGVGAYLLHVSETAMCDYDASLGCAGAGGLGFWDAAWALSVTLLTVGYGDVPLRSHPGRAVAAGGALVGLLTTAVVVASTSSFLSLSRSESKVLTFLRKDANRRRLLHNAAVVVQRAWRFHHAGLDAHPCPSTPGASHVPVAAATLAAQQQLYAALRAQRRAKRHAHAHDGVDANDRHLTLLEALDVSVDDIRDKIEALEDSLLPAAMRHEAPHVAAAAAAAVVAPDPALLPDAPGAEQRAAEQPPVWARPIERGLAAMLDRLESLQGDVADIARRLDEHVEATEGRLGELERALI